MANRPNILLVISDQQRRNSLGAYGCRYVSTPNLDAIAESGTRYDRAYCNAPVCTPSRACLLTGKTLTGHGVYNLFDTLPDEEKLLPYFLREAGYATALVGKLHVSGIMNECNFRHPGDGFDFYELSHEPTVLLDAPENAYGKWLREHYPEEYEAIKEHGKAIKNRPVHSHFSTWVSERGADYIRNRDKERPFFLNLGYFDPHSPYDHHPKESEALLHEEWREEIVRDCEESPAEMNMVRHIQCKDPETRFTPEEAEQLRRGYFSGVSFLDLQLGKVIDALKEEGIYDDTMIIYTSDHGDMICDHNLLGKGPFFYDDCTNVPLLIKYPHQREGRVDTRCVQLNDLFATVMQEAGVSENIPAESLPIQSVKRELAVCEHHGCGQLDLGKFPHPVKAVMLTNDRYKLNIYHDTLEMQLFDLESDPEELHNLAGDMAYAPIMLGLMQKYMQRKAANEYERNHARGGLSEIPYFSKLKLKS